MYVKLHRHISSNELKKKRRKSIRHCAAQLMPKKTTSTHTRLVCPQVNVINNSTGMKTEQTDLNEMQSQSQNRQSAFLSSRFRLNFEKNRASAVVGCRSEKNEKKKRRFTVKHTATTSGREISNCFCTNFRFRHSTIRLFPCKQYYFIALTTCKKCIDSKTTVLVYFYIVQMPSNRQVNGSRITTEKESLRKSHQNVKKRQRYVVPSTC